MENSPSDNLTVLEVDQLTYDHRFEQYAFSLFTSAEWIDALANDHNTPIYLHFVKNGHVVAKLAGHVARDSFWAPMLFFYAGPALLTPDPHTYNRCVAALESHAKKRGFKRIRIECLDLEKGFEIQHNRFTPYESTEYVMEMDPTLDILSKFDRNNKRNICKAIKQGATFQVGNSEQLLSQFWDILKRVKTIRYAVHGDHYATFAYRNLRMDGLSKLLKNGMGHIHYATLMDQTHCMMFVVTKAHKAVGLIIAASEQGYQSGLHPYIYYQSATHMAQQGITTYNISGTDNGDRGQGLARFKQAIGFSPKTIYGGDTYFIQWPWRWVSPVVGRYKYKDKKIKI